MQKVVVIFLILLTFFLSCSPVIRVSPEHIKKIYVKPFYNSTSEAGLEVEFTNAVIEEILRDGRICPVNTNEESDGILTAVIKQYITHQLFTFGNNNSSGPYEIIIVVNVSLFDRNKNIVLWTESNMKGIQMDYTKDLKSVRDNIWERFSRDIVRRIVRNL
ncbi:MAG: LPS assembly lipoprotein LptE [Endomicrobium sp.]|jgi:hypothetical protein|nr:LPS assembly lipoprotein LptE [Endomicrobium sp.]